VTVVMSMSAGPHSAMRLSMRHVARESSRGKAPASRPSHRPSVPTTEPRGSPRLTHLELTPLPRPFERPSATYQRTFAHSLPSERVWSLGCVRSSRSRPKSNPGLRSHVRSSARFSRHACRNTRLSTNEVVLRSETSVVRRTRPVERTQDPSSSRCPSASAHSPPAPPHPRPLARSLAHLSAHD